MRTAPNLVASRPDRPYGTVGPPNQFAFRATWRKMTNTSRTVLMPRDQYFLLFVVLLLLLAPFPASAADFEAGVAVVDITGPPGYRMSGYFNERLNTGTHDPLQAKAVVFRQGKTQAALVFCDLIGLSLDVSRRAREQMAHKTGIPAPNILVHGTHSHTGPLYDGALRKHFHDQAIEKLGKDPHEEVDYPSFLVQRIAEAIAQAQSDVRSTKMLAGIAEQRGLSFNRRFHMKDGTGRFNPGKLNPQLIRPAASLD